MKIHESLDCNVTIQNFGSNLLLICRAEEENLELMLNSFVNFGAISLTKNNFGQIEQPKLEFSDGQHLSAVFWTTKKKLEQYFRTIFWLKTSDEQLKTFKLNNHSSKKVKENPFWNFCKEWAKSMVKELMENHAEQFINYYSRRKEGQIEPYKNGNTNHSVIEAGDFKEAILQFAFQPKD